jgi:CelD/BcsL family acetyltransferase involved in cellulose biosynthesis
VASADPDFGAILFTLRANGHLIAAHLALAGVQRLHAWIIAHDDGFARYSPGQILLHELVRWASENGYREVDLGPGDSQFKVRSANTRREVGNGFVGRPSPSTWLRAAAYGVRDTAESLPLGKFSALPGKAMRRLDVIRSL